MSTQIFVNLPVKDLNVSRAFYAALGYSINEAFSNQDAACVVISNQIYVMLLTHPFMSQFTKKAIADATTSTEVINALSSESREAVQEMTRKAIEAGGKSARPTQDLGFMYSEAFEDPDGHIWELVFMDMDALAQGAMEHLGG